MALARNAELNPPALGAAGAASSFLAGSSVLDGSSFLGGSSFLASSAAPGKVNAGALPAVAPPKLNADEAAVVVDANGDAGAAAADEAPSGEADAPPNENPPPELELDADEPAAAAPPKLNPPDAAAEDAPNDGALPAVPKPNPPDDTAELAAAPPKLKAPAAPAFGAAGSSAGPFPAALSRSSWRAFCAASYPALALARNAELNPPATGATGATAGLAGDATTDAAADAAAERTGDDAALPAASAAAAAPLGTSPASTSRARMFSAYLAATFSSRCPTRMTVTLWSAVATSTVGPCGSGGRDLSAGLSIRPPRPPSSTASPVTKLLSSSAPASGIAGTHRSSSICSALAPEPFPATSRTQSWLSHAFRCDASATFH